MGDASPAGRNEPSGAHQDHQQQPPPVEPLPTPATHAYLGEATTGTSLARKDLEVGSTVDMPILSLPGVVLFPGESLPLRLHNPAYALLAESLLGEERAVGTDVRGSGGGESGERRQAARHLGVVNRLSSRLFGGLLVRTSPVGTTAEIRSGYGGSPGDEGDRDSDSDGGGGGGAGLAVMARGRHRFRLVEDLGWRRGVRYWKVVICPDLCPGPLRAPVPRPFRSPPGRGRARGGGHWAMAIPKYVVEKNSPAALAARAVSLLREQREQLNQGLVPPPPPPPGMPEARASGAGVGGAAQGTVEDGESMPQAPPAIRGRTTPAAVPPSPARERESPSRGLGRGGPGFNTFSLQRRQRAGRGERETDVREEEEEESEEGEGEAALVPRRERELDPTVFSFWLAANLPLDDDARQQLLMLDSVVMRLRLEVKHLEKTRRRALCCAGCGVAVAWEGDVFTLPGAEGVVGAYVNPMGHVHQTVTVRNARGLMLLGGPEEEHTWFPGYAWTTAYCEQCHSHLGWRFTAVNRAVDGGQQQPQPPPPPQGQHPVPSFSSPSLSGSLPSSPSSAARQRTGASGARGWGAQAASGPEIGPLSFFGLCRSSLVGEVLDS